MMVASVILVPPEKVNYKNQYFQKLTRKTKDFSLTNARKTPPGKSIHPAAGRAATAIMPRQWRKNKTRLFQQPVKCRGKKIRNRFLSGQRPASDRTCPFRGLHP
ncbi:MAG: hypothetical protein M0Z75_16305, partial [Nitrospiraceae bacterium]|nr:hypothetical protein [Nitrospiraceae bacterium]